MSPARLRKALILSAALLPAMFVTPAGAFNRLAAPPGHVQVAGRTQVSLDEAAERVRADTGGRILSAETVRRGGRAVHRIKVLLPSGHVRIVHVGADGG
jgi:uncharacterized membrane protein YkoI